MQNRGLPVAYVLTAGNQAQTGLSALIEAVLDDPKVTAIGLHIEGFGNISEIEAVLVKARQKQIPVIALKVGTSDTAQAMTLSHTASLAGSDRLASAFFARMSVARVHCLDELLETLKLLHVLGPSPDGTIGSLSCSGGEASMIGDFVESTGLELRALSVDEVVKVGKTLPAMVTISNPLDYHTFTWGDRKSLTQTYSVMLGCGFGLTCLVLDIPRQDRCIDNGCEAALAAAIDAAKRSGARLAIVSSLPENMTEALADRLIKEGIAPLMGLQTAVRAADAAAQIGQRFKASLPMPLFVEQTSLENTKTIVLDECMSKSILRDCGVQIPEHHLAQTIDEAVTCAESLGFPVVLKAVSSELAHKTEMDAVALNLTTAAEVRAAADKLASLNTPLLVEKMVQGPLAEMIIGISRDCQFGTYLTIGAGGVMVELLQDVRVLLLPTTPNEIRDALLSLKTAPLLTRFRGGPAADLEAIVDTVMRVAKYAMDEGAALEELDINPLIVCQSGAYAADALIRKRVYRGSNLSQHG